MGAANPSEHLDHQKIACAESAIEPDCVAEACVEFVEAALDSILDEWHAFSVPRLIVLHEHCAFSLNDQGLHSGYRGEHPCNCARSGVCIYGQEALVMLSDMQDDCR